MTALGVEEVTRECALERGVVSAGSAGDWLGLDRDREEVPDGVTC